MNYVFQGNTQSLSSSGFSYILCFGYAGASCHKAVNKSSVYRRSRWLISSARFLPSPKES